jgi:hypothetical protein
VSLPTVKLAHVSATSYGKVVTEKLKALMAEYGRLAMVTYFTIFALVLASFYAAIVSGFQPESSTESMGTLGAAWLATKLTQPLRIGATLILTPIIGMALKRFRARGVDDLSDEKVNAERDIAGGK